MSSSSRSAGHGIGEEEEEADARGESGEDAAACSDDRLWRQKRGWCRSRWRNAPTTRFVSRSPTLRTAARMSSRSLFLSTRDTISAQSSKQERRNFSFFGGRN